MQEPSKVVHIRNVPGGAAEVSIRPLSPLVNNVCGIFYELESLGCMLMFMRPFAVFLQHDIQELAQQFGPIQRLVLVRSKNQVSQIWWTGTALVHKFPLLRLVSAS